ncbi:hypothetical protein [Pinirhizobacter sp.]|jgi:hypothetical protein|uniref:hypothetical protein n=1 Tax=Pinirhizobacter sp. TaxID=2950432 RepID=UPI002F411FC5
MPDIIDFLERIGCEPGLRDQGDVLARVLEDACIEPAQRAAILAGDVDGLRSLLGHGAMFALQMPAEEQPDDEREPGEEDEEDEEDDRPGDDGRTQLRAREIPMACLT